MDYCLVSFGGMFAGWTFRILKKKKQVANYNRDGRKLQ